MDKIIFGDNQFFGVNHMSLDKTIVESQRFAKDEAIYKTLSDVHDIGINSFMFTTHERFENVFRLMRKDQKFTNFHFIPCIPYAHKYANAITELGIIGGIKKYIPGNLFLTGVKGAVSIISNEYVELMKMLIDSEMKLVEGLNVQALFLQNIVTDLLIGLGMDQILGEFATYVKQKYKILPGVITMNFAKATDIFSDKLHMPEVAICTPINKIGFRMNPSQKLVEESIALHKTPIIAMSIFASGAVPYKDAISYIASLKGIDSILFGASSKQHIEETYQLLNSNSN